MNKFIGIALILFALAIAIIPSFTDCESQGKVLTLANGKEVQMKCHWTAQSEIAVGLPLLAVGVMLILTRRKETQMILGVMGTVLGVVTIMLPSDVLIGVCTTPTMICHTVMKPALTVLGSLVIAGSVGAMVVAQRYKE